MWRALVLLAILQGAASPTTPTQAETASIEGIVRLNGSAEPLAGVLVVLDRRERIAQLQSGRPPSLDLTVTAATDADGRFSFKGIAPGAFTLEFALNGFVRETYGQGVFPGRGREFDLAPGETLRDVSIHLTPAAGISGHLRDGAKRALADVPVRLMRSTANRAGKTFELVSATRTNDRGEYRFFFMTPGRYFLSAGTEPPGPTSNETAPPYAYRLYPGVRDPEAATPLDLEPGAAMSGVDWVLERETLHAIRGRVIDGATGQPPASGTTIILSDRHSTQTAAQGIFEFRNILRGTYGLRASLQRNPAPAATGRGFVRAAASGPPAVGYAPVEVVDRDVDAVVIVIPPESSIKGRLTVDAKDGGASIPAGATLRLAPAFSTARGPAPNLPAAQVFRLNSDGVLLITGSFAPGDYRIEASPASRVSDAQQGTLPQIPYVKAALLGGIDLFTHLARLPAGDAQTLDIRLGWTNAVVDGVVTGERSEPVAGIEVVLAPNGESMNYGPLRRAITDREGHFKFVSVVPGDYRASVRTALRPYAYSDPDLQRERELNGRPVHVTEQSKVSLELKTSDR